jgi:hypothetical protein
MHRQRRGKSRTTFGLDVVFIIRQGQAYCAALFDLQGFLNLTHTDICPIESVVASGYQIRSGFPVFT